MANKAKTPTGGSGARAAGDLSDTTLGEFTILKKLGSGGMGAVYLATDALNRRVALKVATLESTEAQDRFKREALTSAQLTHPNIVTVYSAGHIDGTPYLAMEFVEGDSLRSVICPKGSKLGVPLPLRRAVDITLQVTEALDYAHSLGVIHRDIKPENIMLQATSRGERVRLLDFGIALRKGDPRMTREGEAQGTLYYIAPESLMSPPRYDSRSDMYALGLVLYEMLTGRLPFPMGTIEGIIGAKLNVAHITKESTGWRMSDALFDVLQKVLYRDPNKRYENVIEFREALQAAMLSIERAQVGGSCRELYAESKIAFAAGDFAKALEMARKVVDLDPHFEDVQSLVVLCERKLHEQEAQTLLSRASEAMDRRKFADAVAMLDRVVELGFQQEVAEAKKEVALRSLKAEQHLQTARDLADKLQWKAAWKALEDARKLAPDMPGLLEMRQRISDGLGHEDMLHKGMEAANDRRWTEAVALLSRVVERDPGNGEAAELLTRSRRARDSERLYGDAIKAFAAEELDRCDELLARLSELAPDYPDSENLRPRLKEEFLLLGLYEEEARAEQEGSYDRAMEILERMRSRRPIYRDVDDRLLRLRRWKELEEEQRLVGELIDRGEFDDALEALARIRAADSAFPVQQDLQRKAESGRELQAILTKAQAAFRRDRWDECIDGCDKILRVVPQHQRVRELRGRALQAKRRGLWYRWRKWLKVAAVLAVIGAAVAVREQAVATVTDLIFPPLPAKLGGPGLVATGSMVAADSEAVRVWVPGQGVMASGRQGEAKWTLSATGLESAIGGMPNRLALLSASPGDPKKLYLGLDAGLFVSRDGGLTWAGSSWTSGVRGLVVVQPKGQPDRLYLSGSGAAGKGVRSSSDPMAAEWQEVSSKQMGEVQGFAVDPREVNTLYASTLADRRVWRSFDAGGNWGSSKMPEGSQIVSLVSVEGKPREIVAAANPGGLLRSEDGGENWQPVPEWPRGVPADSVEAGPNGFLLAGGWGGGLWAGKPQGGWKQVLTARVQGLAAGGGPRPAIFVLVEEGGRPRLLELSPTTLEQSGSVEVALPVPAAAATVGEGDAEAPPEPATPEGEGAQ